MLTGCCKKTVR